MLKRDNLALGVVIGIVLPAAFFGLLNLVAVFIETGSALARPFEPDRMMILALAINIVPIRMYFVNYKLDKTGRGVLLATFLLMVAIFLFIRYF